ncbi:MAG: ParB/RepB/Spo0J family partition protein [Oscillospiraceae bacterium]|jgi:ParB family chromosome partitioning protein|nr:ParB/RepB/Spo0J family partition protein [Oscillospiraceae bacterium]
MPLVKRRGLYETGRVVYLPPGEISVDPAHTRRETEPNAMRELSASIAKYGVLQPLSVRRAPQGGGFELISGERRLRAAKFLQLKEVPCIVLDVGEETSAALVLVENIQRHDMDFIEEARAIERLRTLYSYSQEEVARMIGRTQSAVANKLRLLRLPPELLLAVRDAGLTERHARALLRLPDERAMAEAITRMISDDMNVARAEEYIDRKLSAAAPPNPPEAAEITALPEIPAQPEISARTSPSLTLRLRDHRFYLNSIARGAEIMRRAGHRVTVETAETDETVTVTVTIAAPKKIMETQV